MKKRTYTRIDISEDGTETKRPCTLKEKVLFEADQFWNFNKDKVILGGIIGGCLLTGALVFVRGIKNQKAFTKEVQAKYGPNATHGNIFGGSMSKRRADLEAWEQGNRKTEFNRVMEFAKTLHLGNDDSYTIEGFNDPANNRIAVGVFQQCGQMFHSDWT